MPVSVDEVGINGFDDYALCHTSEVEKVLEETEPILKSDGTLHTQAADAWNPTFSFTFSGKGDPEAGMALATDGGFDHEEIDGGRTIITRLKTGEYEDRNNDWECSGENCPAATAPSEE